MPKIDLMDIIYIMQNRNSLYV